MTADGQIIAVVLSAPTQRYAILPWDNIGIHIQVPEIFQPRGFSLQFANSES